MQLQRGRHARRTNRQSISIRLIAAAVSSALVVLAAAVAASANPSVAGKRAQADAILAEIQTLDEEVESAAERFNGANYELQRLTTEQRQTRLDLKRARRLQDVSQRRVAARLRELYVNGPEESPIEVIVGARSLDEMVDGLELARRVAAQDAEIAREARALRDRVATRQARLTAARERQAVVVDERAAERRAIERKLAERQSLLASIQDEIARIQVAERRRQEELRRQAELALERQRRAAETEVVQRVEAPVPPTPAASGGGGAAPAPVPGAGTGPPPPDADKAARVVAIAMQYLGVPYRWGGASPETGFDCSGLTMYVYAKIGITLPHYAAAQYRMGVPVPKDRLYPGDLVFFNALGHVGMYIGGGNFIHAPKTGDVVKISPLSDPYYVANWVGARRLL